MLPMKKMLSLMLLLAGFLLFMAAGSEISGRLGPPSLGWAILLSLAAQLTVLGSGSISGPSTGKLGFFRAVAFVLFLVQSLTVPFFAYAVAYRKVTHIEMLTSTHLIWGLVGSLSALTLLLISAKLWHPFARA
jgi:hypothetical protein